jgi:hypothetical protein
MSTALTTASIGLGVLAGIASIFTGGASLAAYAGYMAAVAGIAAGAAGVSSAVGEKKAGVSTWKRDLGISIGTGLLSAATFGAGAAISAGVKSSMALNTYRVGVGVGLGMGTYGAIDQSVKVGTGETQLGKGHVWDTLNFTNAVVGGVMSVGQAGGIVSSASKGSYLQSKELNVMEKMSSTSDYGIAELPTKMVNRWQGNLLEDRGIKLPSWLGKKTTPGVSRASEAEATTPGVPRVSEGEATTPGVPRVSEGEATTPGVSRLSEAEDTPWTSSQNLDANINLPRRALFGLGKSESNIRSKLLMLGDISDMRDTAGIQMYNKTKVGFGIGKLTKPIAINAGMNISAATAGLGIGSQSSQASEEAMYQSTVTTVTVGIDHQS